jgi:hypothetical protein
MWRDGVLGTALRFRADSGAGVYRFRARLRDGSGDAALWSSPASMTVR